MPEKYPRTLHLPWSPGASSDDKIIEDVNALLGCPIVITEKLDGSNMAWTKQDVFARSHAGAPAHPSFDAAKAMHAEIGWRLPSKFTFFGEWCYAVHSIEYDALPGYFFVFGIRDDPHNYWLSWDEVAEMCEYNNLATVPVLERLYATKESGLRNVTKRLANEPSVYGPQKEGVVVRVADGFYDSHFPLAIAKMVRKNHVQTDDHWKHQKIRKQKLIGE